ncbi:MAG: PAS domain-containing protein [Acidobacteria bacterium]|nr:PAS domain-containing protein [Acidobacteriota bacterium]
MNEELLKLTAAEIDSLPFGYVALAPDGTIRKYNRYEADLARRDPQEVLGKNFFREVAPCTQVQEFEGRFRSFVEAEDGEPSLSFDFEFTFRHGTQRVRIGFVRSPLGREIIMTVNRVRDLDLSQSAELKADPARGSMENAAGQRVVITNADFWHALDGIFADAKPEDRRVELHRLGLHWGLHHALRVEGFVQKRYLQTLREVELQVALESLSGSLGTLGLGSFEVRLEFRRRGLLVVEHRNSPYPVIFGEVDGPRCDLLAGVHAGFLSHLSGRNLVAREISCSRRPEMPCRFVVGTERRIDRLLDPVEGSSDAHLLMALRSGEEGRG